uniref:Uncharacterized protein n=1 Tax=Brassica oleracea var. oleracea TaxID=109376 RepID=A0A0D3BMG1_BRAOL
PERPALPRQATPKRKPEPSRIFTGEHSTAVGKEERTGESLGSTRDVPQFMDQSIGADQHGDQDVLNNLTETTELTEPELVFPDQLDILRPTVEPDLAWVVKKPKTDMHSYLADHPDSPASVLIFIPCIHLVQMNLDIILRAIFDQSAWKTESLTH